MMKLFLYSLLFILVTNTTTFSDIILKPYLQAVTQTSIYVVVECNSPDTVTVRFGVSQFFDKNVKTEIISFTDKSPSTFVHKIIIKNLQPNTVYFYSAEQGQSKSDISSFKTAVLPGTSFRFAWMADCRSDTIVHSEIAKLINAYNPDFSLYGGDLCVKPDYEYWKKEFFIYTETELISRVPFFNTPGNHEGWKQNTKAFTQAPESGSGFQDYYSFDYGDMHVLVLNNELDCYEGSSQYKFAENDLSQTHQIWKIVMFHEPAYCFGAHGENTEMKKLSRKVFVPNKVDAVFNGHSHFYQHNFVQGIHHFVIGSAGAELYSPDSTTWTLRSAKDYNFGIIDVTSNKFEVKVFNNKNIILDSLILEK
jgi:predicted phosphodiesterase